MKIKKALVILDKNGPDYIYLYTDLPTTFPNGVGTDQSTFHLQAMANYGVDWVRENFGLDPEVIQR